MSLSARRAWIEITQRRDFKALGLVALRKESVDRNPHCSCRAHDACQVALRKESVDRNFHAVQIKIVVVKSLSARRAWIEILVPFDVIRPAIGRSPQGERG